MFSVVRMKFVQIRMVFLPTDRMDNLGLNPVMDKISQLIGQWPLLNSSWNASEVDMVDTLKKLRKESYSFFVYWGVQKDREDPTRNMIGFFGGGLGLGSRKYYFANQSEYVRVAFKDYVAKVTKVYYNKYVPAQQQNESVMMADLQDIWDFDRTLANVSFRVELNFPASVTTKFPPKKSRQFLVRTKDVFWTSHSPSDS